MRLGGNWLLNGLSWRINTGEHWVIWGPNGTGKTTLAKVLLDQVAVVQGHVRRCYRENAGDYPHRPAMALVSPDQYHYYYDREQMQDEMRHFAGRLSDHTPAAALLDEQLHPEVSDDDKARRSEVASWLGLARLRDKPLNALSTGEFRRMLLARAVLANPRMLILDEPFNNLDAQSTNTLTRILYQLGSTDTQLVLITHRVVEIPDVFSHVIQLDHGRVAWQGSRTAFINRAHKHNLAGESTPSPQPKTDHRSSCYGEPIIKMRKVRVRFGGHLILDDIDWTVRRGENWALIGPNGAGKTTMLRLITGDNLQAYANHLELFGWRKGSGESVWDIKAKIGFVADDLQARYQRNLTGYDVICSGFFDSVGLYRFCSFHQKEAAGRWIDTLGLNDLVDETFTRLSFGQQRLLLIARAMVKSPILLILDEPCSGLDVMHRQRVLHLIDIIGAMPTTGLLFVSHHSDEIPSCVDRRLFLEAGRVVRVS